MKIYQFYEKNANLKDHVAIKFKGETITYGDLPKYVNSWRMERLQTEKSCKASCTTNWQNTKFLRYLNLSMNFLRAQQEKS